MAEFGDFEFGGGGERRARPADGPTPPGAAAAAPPVPSPSSAANPVGEPVTRGRLSSLVAPALILVAAAAILSWRPPEPQWSAAPDSGDAKPKPNTVPLIVRVAPLPETGTPVPVIEPSPATTATASAPSTAAAAASAPAPEIGTAATGLAVPAATGEPPLELLTAEQARPAGAGAGAAEGIAEAPPMAPPAAAPFAVAVPNDPVQTQLAMAAIAEEARRKQEEVNQTAALRDSLPALERKKLAEQMLAERQATEGRRVVFRRELAALLQREGERAGPAIWALAEARHAEPSPAAEKAVAAAILGAKGRLDRAGRVALFRAYGLDETIIFAEMVREQIALMPSRRGPRTREEAIVRAARSLLALKPDAGAPRVDARN
jgi:hypothetical protein